MLNTAITAWMYTTVVLAALLVAVIAVQSLVHVAVSLTAAARRRRTADARRLAPSPQPRPVAPQVPAYVHRAADPAPSTFAAAS